MARSKSWNQMSTSQRTVVLTLVAVQAVLAAMAQRDLSSRPASQVRGPKAVWRFLVLNPFGAGAYVLLGRTG